MSATQTGPALAGYRDTVDEMLRAGEPFGRIEGRIDAVADLKADQRDSLWLIAYFHARPETAPGAHAGAPRGAVR